MGRLAAFIAILHYLGKPCDVSAADVGPLVNAEPEVQDLAVQPRSGTLVASRIATNDFQPRTAWNPEKDESMPKTPLKKSSASNNMIVT